MTETILQGYAVAFQVALIDPNTSLPFNLTGATQINVLFQSILTGVPLIESLATALVTTGTTTSTAASLPCSSVAGVKVGHSIAGTGIPAGTYVKSISGTTVTMTQNATASGSVSVTFGNTNVTVVSPAGAGLIKVVVPAVDSLNIGANSLPQALQVSVVNADGSESGFVLPGFVQVTTPPYGVV